MYTMRTYGGEDIDPLQMAESDVSLRDVAHALSLLCRGGGHLKSFYSVAQHSINCMKEARARGWSERMQLACLLHDASEAYLSDVIRPLKARLANYSELETLVMAKIWRRFGLSDLSQEENSRWKQVDDALLRHEFQALMNGEHLWQPIALSSVPDTAQRRWQDVEAEFLLLATQLLARQPLSSAPTSPKP